MQNTTYKLDGGKNFGAGIDPVSELMYRSSVPTLLKNVATKGKDIADYGGGNGILRRFLHQADSYTVVDVDESKKSNDALSESDNFICDDITTHREYYDLIVCRYVLHYLTDRQIKLMFQTIRQTGTPEILLIQFVNQGFDLKVKREISAEFETDGEKKIFRNCRQLFDLLDGFHIENVDRIDYLVTSDFYRNRFGIKTRTVPHEETIYSILLKPKNL